MAVSEHSSKQKKFKGSSKILVYTPPPPLLKTILFNNGHSFVWLSPCWISFDNFSNLHSQTDLFLMDILNFETPEKSNKERGSNKRISRETVSWQLKPRPSSCLRYSSKVRQSRPNSRLTSLYMKHLIISHLQHPIIFMKVLRC